MPYPRKNDRLAQIEERLVHTEAKIDRLAQIEERLAHIELKIDQLLTVGYWDNVSKIDDCALEPNNKPYDFAIFGMWFTGNYGAALTSFAIGRLIEKLGYSWCR